MAINAYLKLKGQVQGDIKGGVTQKGREGKIAVMAFDHEIMVVRDAVSGLTAGKRVHKPFVITKGIDKSSPLLYKALVTNEYLIVWELQCFAARSNGSQVNNYNVTLTNAKIVDIKSEMLNNNIPENAKMPMMEEVSFIYEKISWTWVDGQITTSDDWSLPVV
jgi:type VI secretion system secreted protein Hcp